MSACRYLYPLAFSYIIVIIVLYLLFKKSVFGINFFFFFFLVVAVFIVITLVVISMSMLGVTISLLGTSAVPLFLFCLNKAVRNLRQHTV